MSTTIHTLKLSATLPTRAEAAAKGALREGSQ